MSGLKFVEILFPFTYYTLKWNTITWNYTNSKLLIKIFICKQYISTIKTVQLDIGQDSYYVLYLEFQHFVQNKWNKLATAHRKHKLYTGNIINIIF